MEMNRRYEIREKLAAGDFSTVFRARDLELGREVAVKQIHHQFLDDERQLERYWQEAQLLASLQHPHVIAIYDIDKHRGWLVLELMEKSLLEYSTGDPIELEYLRRVLTQSLRALRFLHHSGIIHGDIKPSNLLIDKNRRVKVGDFGLARRASNEEGSLLKGTTKYMAPEMLSLEFGDVGPASDLYSLGFCAYEFLCGSNFESLFPGLSTFGRDKQLAWMMWHSTVDQRLPRIESILQGVPEDLAYVIQKLCTKDPDKRYRSADEALEALKRGPDVIRVEQEAEEQAAAGETVAAKKKRTLTYAALACSMLMCFAMIFLPGPQEPTGSTGSQPIRGIVRSVKPDENELVLIVGEEKFVRPITFEDETNIRLNNEKYVLLEELKPGDRVKISSKVENSKRTILVMAFRPRSSNGRIQGIDADAEQLVLVTEDQSVSRELVLAVPKKTPIKINGKSRNPAGQTLELTNLKVGDRAEIEHVEQETGQEATSISAKRLVWIKAFVRGKVIGDASLSFSEERNGSLRVLPFEEDCKFTVNGQPTIGGVMLTSRDLRVGDEIRIEFDTHIVRVDSKRSYQYEGTVQRLAEQTVEVTGEVGGGSKKFTIGPETTIALEDETVRLDELRAGDEIQITHASPDAKVALATTIVANRPIDPTRWAIIIGNGNYLDDSVPVLRYPVRDAKLLQQTLVGRHHFDPDQARLFEDSNQAILEQGISDLLDLLGPEDEVVVYFGGHAYQDEEDGGIYLAPGDFILQRPNEKGLGLKWLLDRLGTCLARKKLLLLDASRESTENDGQHELSTAEMVRILKRNDFSDGLLSTTILASCEQGQCNIDWESARQGLFGYVLAEAFSGRADGNGDNRVDPAELAEYAKDRMNEISTDLRRTQSPVLFPPEGPPRLSRKAKESIRGLLSSLQVENASLTELETLFVLAAKEAPSEAEPWLAWGLVQLKHGKRGNALQPFEEVIRKHPDLLLGHEGAAWVQFQERDYLDGLPLLLQLLRKVSKSKEGPRAQQAQRIYYWVGSLREIAERLTEGSRHPLLELCKKIDEEIEFQGRDARIPYRKGRDEIGERTDDFDRRIRQAVLNDTKQQLAFRKKQLGEYVSFAFDEAAKSIELTLDE